MINPVIKHFLYKLEISVKSGTDTTITLSLVIHRVRLKKNLQISTLASNEGETQKTNNFDGS